MSDQTFTVDCGFFDAINNDRLYSAEDMNKPYSEFISDGVFATPTGTAISGSSDYINSASGTEIALTDTIDARFSALRAFGKSTLYQIKETIESEGEIPPPIMIPVVNYAGSSCEITGLANDNVYKFLVQAYTDYNDASSWSSDDSRFYVFVTPHIPTENAPNVTITPGNSQITLSWDAISGATKYAINRYNPATNKYTAIQAAYTDTEYTVTGLNNGTRYYYLVQAYVGGSWSSTDLKNHVSAVPHEEAASIVPLVTASGQNGSVVLSWQPRATDAEEMTISSTNGTETRDIDVTTGLPLYGMVVQYAGTYTDANGKQWYSDEINFERGCIIRRLEPTGELSNVSPFDILDPPQEIPLSAAELQDYRACGTLDGSTTISNTSGLFMDVKYIRRIEAMKLVDDLSAVSNLKVVSEGSSRNIRVLPGKGLCAQKWYHVETPVPIEVPANNNINPRIDSVIICVDERESKRNGYIIYRPGTPDQIPQPPALDTLDGMTEYRLANIAVAASASVITDDNITDLRGTAECPWATSQIYQGNLSAFAVEIAKNTSDISDLNTDIADLKAGMSQAEIDINALDVAMDAAQNDIEAIQSDIADTGWTDLGLTSGIIAAPPSIRRVGSEVFLRGAVFSSSPVPVAVGTTVATLPENYRPAIVHKYPAYLYGSVNSNVDYGIAFVTINTNGTIVVDSYQWINAAHAENLTASWLYFDTNFMAN